MAYRRINVLLHVQYHWIHHWHLNVSAIITDLLKYLSYYMNIVLTEKNTFSTD